MNQVLKNAKSYLGNDVIILPSTRKNKKLMIINPYNKYVHFGDKRYKDFTQDNKNKDRQQNYLKRSSNIKGNWKNNKYSPNNLSMNILWK
jgi:hypothetical protein